MGGELQYLTNETSYVLLPPASVQSTHWWCRRTRLVSKVLKLTGNVVSTFVKLKYLETWIVNFTVIRACFSKLCISQGGCSLMVFSRRDCSVFTVVEYTQPWWSPLLALSVEKHQYHYFYTDLLLSICFYSFSTVPFEERVFTVLKWLQLPANKRLFVFFQNKDFTKGRWKNINVNYVCFDSIPSKTTLSRQAGFLYAVSGGAG